MKPFLIVFIACFSLNIIAQPNTDVFLFDLNHSSGKLELSNIQNISNKEGYDNQPSFLDNNILVFSSTRNGQTDIAQYNLKTGETTWLCNTEGSEYSPIKIPGQKAFSAINLGLDNSQKLYSYNLNDDSSEILIDNLLIGYHAWKDKNTLFLAVLEPDMLSLVEYNLKHHKADTIQRNIGRSLLNIPNSNLISYVSKEKPQWEIRSFNPKTNKSSLIAQTLPNSEDLVWLEDGSILMAKNEDIYHLNPKQGKEWVQIASLKELNLHNITRMAVSPDGTKLALVAENAASLLEPKLDNIAWISGNWKGEAFGGQTEENWSEPSGGSMMATFKLINDGKVSFYEIEIIREVNNTLILQLKHFNSDLTGWEDKDETVDFPLKEITPTKVIFEGMTFEKISDTEMNVYVDIHNKSGEVEIVKFYYKKSN
ncbi:DUF6265 family protein [Mangrovimonas sp. TPBH4]|uniref:DUF6265 family protein n=1 Tax=Mangrovimonas sp. TPBH4 TaxID=1645914 RepID=UPI0006B63921|nr:DUF6265 family protein [Mangrovimonas sp. TPBH4]